MPSNILECFSELKDLRRIKSTYPLINIIFIGMCAILAGAENFVQMV
jgi:hypothetical protein